MIAPVVVKPETASKMASVSDMSSCSDSNSGAAPATPSTTQNSATTRKPSRTRSSRDFLRTGHQIKRAEREQRDERIEERLPVAVLEIQRRRRSAAASSG